MGAEYISYYGPPNVETPQLKAQNEIVGYSNYDDMIKELERKRSELRDRVDNARMRR